MKKLILSFLLLLFCQHIQAAEWPNPFSVDPSSIAVPLAWDGPVARLEKTTEGVKIKINDQYAPAIFLSLNPQAITTEKQWTDFDREINLATQNGVPVIELMLRNHSYAEIQSITKRLENKNVYIHLRYEGWFAETENLPSIVGVGLNNKIQTLERKAYSMDEFGVWKKIPFHPVLSDAWLKIEIAGTQKLLKNLMKSGLSKKIISFKPTLMEGGEWFQVPLSEQDGKLANADEVAIKPWNNPDLYFYVETNAETKAMYKNWVTRTDYKELSGDLPTAENLVNAGSGMSFIGTKDKINLNAFLYNQFISSRVAYAQALIAKSIKVMTNNKSLYVANGGYIYSLAYYNGSSHLGLGELLKDPNVDGVVAPYNYRLDATRKNGQGFIPHGPMDSAELYGKIWMHEDDSRPSWSVDFWKGTTTDDQDFSLLKRNMLTSKFHQNQLYLFDLTGEGWFGNLERGAQRLWPEVRAFNNLKSENNFLEPEVAIFVDEKSYSLHPGSGMGGPESYSFSSEMFISTLNAISKTGVPYKLYRLDDLNNSQLNLDKIKCAVFLNSYYMDAKTLQNIKTRLSNSNRLLVAHYGFGIVDEKMALSTTRMNSLLGMNFTFQYSKMNTPYYQLSPWISTTGYDSVLEDNVYIKANTGFKAAFLTFPKSSTSLYRKLFNLAGVHAYTQDGSTVEVSKDMIMVHSGAKSTIDIKLPKNYKVVELGEKGVDKILCEACSAFTLKNDDSVTGLFKLMNPPLTKLPKGMFRVGGAGFGSTGDYSYCYFESGAHFKQCGYTQANYDTAPQFNLIAGYTNEGNCKCSSTPAPTPTPAPVPTPAPAPTPAPVLGPKGLFKWEWSKGNWGGAISKDGKQFCYIATNETLTKCGYNSTNYMAAAKADVVGLQMTNIGECTCK